MHLDLLQGDQSGDITVQMNPAEWSDWNGQSGLVHPENFAIAASKVQEIGLSFGGDCFFETGVKADAPPESFSSSFTETR